MEILTIIAIILGPFAGIAAQKAIEASKSVRDKKIWIFKTLMATRANVVSHQHVQALNMIDLEFSEKNPKEKEVKRTWKEYLDHMSSLPEEDRKDQAKMKVWQDKCHDYLTDLLFSMGQALGYDFDRVTIKKGIYSPNAHEREKVEERLLRSYLIDILTGERPFPVIVTFNPGDPEGQEVGKRIVVNFDKILSGNEPLRIAVEAEDNNGE